MQIHRVTSVQNQLLQATSTPNDYAWAYRAAIDARQVDQFLRQLPVEPSDAKQVVQSLLVAGSVRDRAQADNMDWIQGREGSTGKILVFAHTVHLAMSPVSVLWVDDGPLEGGARNIVAGPYRYEVAGTFLRRRLGAYLVTIGSVIGTGHTGCGGSVEQLPMPFTNSLAALLRDAGGADSYWIDMRSSQPNPSSLALSSTSARRRRTQPSECAKNSTS